VCLTVFGSLQLDVEVGSSRIVRHVDFMTTHLTKQREERHKKERGEMSAQRRRRAGGCGGERVSGCVSVEGQFHDVRVSSLARRSHDE
jgi:hypothetical protein